MEEIIAGIKEILMQEKREDGRNLYQMTNESWLVLDDESARFDLLLNEWCKDDASVEKYESLIWAAMDYFRLVMIQQITWVKVKDDGCCLLYVSNSNDIMYMQISDSHVHIHLHYSGQY